MHTLRGACVPMRKRHTALIMHAPHSMPLMQDTWAEMKQDGEETEDEDEEPKQAPNVSTTGSKRARGDRDDNRPPKPAAAQRKCSICHQPGHTKRKCQAKRPTH